MSGMTSRWSMLNWFRSNSNSEQEKQADDSPATTTADKAQAGESTHLAVRHADARQDHAMEQLQGAYQEVVGLMNAIQDHMAAQSDRSERLLTMMEGLPEALKTLPESQRNQARMLEAIQGHLAQQTKNTAGLTQAIQGLAQAADNHERSMSIIQQQLDTTQQSSQHMLTSFNSLSQTLDRMSESSQAGTNVLERLVERGERADTQMRELFTQNQRQTTIMSVVSWALAIVALGVASAVAIWVSQQVMAGSAAAPPAAVQPEAGAAAYENVGAVEATAGHAAVSAMTPTAVDTDYATAPLQADEATAAIGVNWLFTGPDMEQIVSLGESFRAALPQDISTGHDAEPQHSLGTDPSAQQ